MKKKHLIILLFALSVSAFGFTQQAITSAEVTFKIKNMGFNVDGVISETEIKSDFSDSDISNWRLEGWAGVSSLDTDNDKRDEHLYQEDYFDLKNHPKIFIKARTFEEIADNLYTVKIDLTIKGITRSLQAPMRIVKTETTEELYASFEINRKDFDVGGSSFVLSSTVKIRVEYKTTLN
ncbi:MAG: YceI family protein [Psychroserpens sp.]|nr:YceI family protein [Psychroserpens sp.]